MKVLVRAYLAHNFGDDLFLHILFCRYPHVDFEIDDTTGEYDTFLSNYENAKSCSGPSFFDKLHRRLDSASVRHSVIKNYDAVVYVGGSIFMENTSNNLLDRMTENEVYYCKTRKIPYYFLSCNFGPYESIHYFNRKKRLFEKCADVCFRDDSSYSLFSDIDAVRLAADMVFSFCISDYSKKARTLGVSVVDISNRQQLKAFESDYIDFLVKICNEHINLGYEITFFDFCKHENDKNMIDKIINKLQKPCSIISYTDNVLEFSCEYMSMEKTVCTRFHSMILSMLAGQEMVPVIYSPKCMSILRDCDMHDTAITMHDLKESPIFCKYTPNTDPAGNGQTVFEIIDALLKNYKNKLH